MVFLFYRGVKTLWLTSYSTLPRITNWQSNLDVCGSLLGFRVFLILLFKNVFKKYHNLIKVWPVYRNCAIVLYRNGVFLSYSSVWMKRKAYNYMTGKNQCYNYIGAGITFARSWIFYYIHGQTTKGLTTTQNFLPTPNLEICRWNKTHSTLCIHSAWYIVHNVLPTMQQ